MSASSTAHSPVQMDGVPVARRHRRSNSGLCPDAAALQIFILGVIASAGRIPCRTVALAWGLAASFIKVAGEASPCRRAQLVAQD